MLHRRRDVIKRRAQLRADALHRANGGNGNERGDQAILDRGSAAGVPNDFDDLRHAAVPHNLMKTEVSRRRVNG